MCLQKCLSKSPRLTSNVSATTLTSHTFRDLMEKGKVKNALRYLSSDHTGGILRMEDSVPVTNRNGDVIECSIQDVLVEKHPNGKPASPSALLSFTQSHVNPILFDQLNGELILKAAMRIQGAPGLSGMDAYAWKRICSSFKSASHDLCHAMAAVARRICCSPIYPDDMSAFVACRLIPLDKCPGIRPIGISETPRRIIAKAVLMLYTPA